MKRKSLVLALLALLAALVLVSCKTETIFVEPEPIDLQPSMQVLFDTRPNNEDLHIIQDVKTLDDIIDNSAAYLMAWELWEAYSESLESYIKKVGELVASPK